MLAWRRIRRVPSTNGVIAAAQSPQWVTILNKSCMCLYLSAGIRSFNWSHFFGSRPWTRYAGLTPVVSEALVHCRADHWEVLVPCPLVVIQVRFGINLTLKISLIVIKEKVVLVMDNLRNECVYMYILETVNGMKSIDYRPFQNIHNKNAYIIIQNTCMKRNQSLIVVTIKCTKYYQKCKTKIICSFF